jgi:Ca2+-binding EF-hand superfamily protein
LGVRENAESGRVEGEPVKDPNDEHRQKAQALMARYGGQIKTMFAHYDKDKDGAIDLEEVVQLLKDAGFGNAFTRRVIANIAISKGDKNDDKKLQYEELEVHLGKVDANKDGVLSPEEINQAGR